MQYLLLLSFFQVIQLCGSVSTFQSQQEKHIFILAGQSNMAGRGGVIDKDTRWDGIVPSECQPNPRILRLNAQLQWVEAREPLHADIDTKKTCGIGPGMPFANAVIGRESGMVVGLVPCAVGGTAIREWEKGEKLYESMVTRAKASLQGGGSIKALLWYQGESDTLSPDDADSYKNNMEKLIGDIRADLHSPTLPIIQVTISSGEGPLIDTVRKAQLRINLPYVYRIDAKGLPLKDDHLHLTTESQVKLGMMLASEYFKHFTS